MEEEQNMLLSAIDEETKKEAEAVANNLLGSMTKTISESKKGDEIDQKLQKALLKLLEKARAALMAAHAKSAAQGKFKRFSTKIEKADQEACNQLVENGEIPANLAFIV